MNKELENLSTSIGNFIQYWGFKKIHGQIWTLLFLTKRPLSSREIQEKLNISKALLSMTLNDLINRNLIKEVGSTTHGRSLYDANDNVIDTIVSVINKREINLVQDTLLKIKNLEKLSKEQLNDNEIDEKRLAKIKKLTMLASKMMSAFVTFQQFSFKSLRSFTKQ